MKRGYSLVGILFVVMGGWVAGQYYYFDTGGTSYPYQQGCPETLFVRINTQTHPSGPVAGLLRLRFDPASFSYSTSSLASDLQSQLFLGSSETFSNWTSPTATPSWVDGSKTLLQIDRNNGSVGYLGTAGLYGTLKFVPVYNQASYVGNFGIVYDGDTIKTTLSYGGVNIIQSSQQNFRLTGAYQVVQQPCVMDVNPPLISIANPSHGASKQRASDGIHFSLSDALGVNGSSVPYVWTGGGIWTGNPAGTISNQYGIDLSTLAISISGNGQSRSFGGNSFDTGDVSASLYAQPQSKTWQYLDRDYLVSLSPVVLFDYGIEKTITLNISARDRLGYSVAQSIIFNQPQAPTLIPGSRSPVVGANFVKFDAPVMFGVQDDWAGVDSGSLRVRLQAVTASGQIWGPYRYSGSQLQLSGIAGQANLPDWHIVLDDHPNFPPSSIVTVHIDVRDMVGNMGIISDYSFVIRPSCSELQCCADKQLQTKSLVTTLFTSNLIISGGNNPYFSGIVGTGVPGYLYCGLDSDGLQIYRGVESDVSAVSVAYVDVSTLQIAGTNNIKAVLSGSTLYLSKLFDYGYLSELRGGAGGGGGVILTKDRCPDGDNSSSYYDRTCDGDMHGSALSCPVSHTSYSDELVDAFQYAYGVGMTNMCPIERANLNGDIIRKHLAKMLVEYGVRIMGMAPNLEKKGCDVFDDMDGESPEMKFYAKTVCQMDLMGLEADGVTPKKSFNPDQTVDRAQFGTILSRMLFGYLYNLHTGENQQYYYVHHLDALKNNNIIKNTNPRLQETRGFVMLMLKRAYDNGLVDYTHFSTSSKNGVMVLINL